MADCRVAAHPAPPQRGALRVKGIVCVFDTWHNLGETIFYELQGTENPTIIYTWFGNPGLFLSLNGCDH